VFDKLEVEEVEVGQDIEQKQDHHIGQLAYKFLEPK
jgi:hypothetical protein